MTLLIAGCDAGQARSDVATVRPMTHQDVREHNNRSNRKNREAKPKPFKGRPLSVSGTGRVKATPDIAVITGLIKSRALADDVAVNDAANIINRVQDALTGLDAQMNFTGIGAADKRDDDCTQYNVEAMNRHYEIVSDNRFNQNIKNQLARGVNTGAKPRPPKPRIKTKLCPVLETEASIGFTLRVQPAGKAAGIISALTDAGVSKVDLFGYDFTDYDALYKDAAAKAVANAKDKAERVAGIAGTQLTEIVSFTVDRPQRTARFGPQAMIVSNHGNRNVSAGSYGNQGGAVLAPPSMPAPPPPPPVVAYAPPTAGNYGNGMQSYEKSGVTSSAYSSSAYSSAQRPTAHYDEILTTGAPNEPLNPNTGSANNALKMSLQAGQRTITVNAYLEYLYETPIDGSIAPDKS